MDRILVVAPHADDETLGLGGAIARMADAGHDVIVAVMTGHGENAAHPLWPRAHFDAVRDEARAACAVLGARELRFAELPAALVASTTPVDVNRVATDLVRDVRPDQLFLPFAWDLHKDHRELAAAFAVAWRPHTDFGRAIKRVCMYEVVSETHWNPAGGVEPGFSPNLWIDIDRTLARKLDAMACYRSQLRDFPDARSLEALEALARWRGSQMSMRAAEALVTVRTLER